MKRVSNSFEKLKETSFTEFFMVWCILHPSASYYIQPSTNDPLRLSMKTDHNTFRLK